MAKVQPFNYEIQNKMSTENYATNAISRIHRAAITTQLVDDQLMAIIKDSWQLDETLAKIIINLQMNINLHPKFS